MKDNQTPALFQQKQNPVAIRLGAPGASGKLKQMLKEKRRITKTQTTMEKAMFSLIITIISIALVAALALATIHYSKHADYIREAIADLDRYGVEPHSTYYAKYSQAYKS